MNEQKSRPLFKGEIVWISNSANGEFRPFIGPSAFLPGNEDMILMPDPEDGTKTVILSRDDMMQAVQQFVTLAQDEWAIIHNPAKTYEPGYPNGKWASGRAEVPPLAEGIKRIVAEGSFPRWPGQIIEVRKAYTLAPDQYLLTRVTSGNIDTEAPYYQILIRCAKIKNAVVAESAGAERPDGETQPAAESSGNSQKSDEKKQAGHGLIVGQRIIIPGNITPQFIPPTGIEVLADTTQSTIELESPDGLPDHEVIRKAIYEGVIKKDNIIEILRDNDLDSIEISEIRKLRDELEEDRKDLFTAIADKLNGRSKNKLADYLRPRLIPEPIKQTLPSDKSVRQARTPKPTQFCTLIDEKGELRNVKGPGRVFPGPNDTFRTEGTTDGVYNDYHLRPDRGILLRVVVEKIGREELINQLPFGAEPQIEEREFFRQGDEIFIGGFDAYLVPSSAVEVIDPITRQPHIGNSHSGIYVEAIPVDQKSGVYVRTIGTGNVTLMHGEVKLLLDPRKEIHEKRQVPPDLWNLIIGAGEPHKKVTEGRDRVITPWALSVLVPNNEAMLKISRDGRRPVIGPRTELLEYEEVPEILNLSKGRPKTDRDLLRTCFLRVDGNHVTDIVDLEPGGGVTKVTVTVSYGVRFITQKPGEEKPSEEKATERMIAWFNDKNYVQLLADSTRSRLRANARSHSLQDLFLRTEEFARDTILGIKPEGGHRPGLLFEENWMLVYEVNVLDVKVPDEEVAEAMHEAHRAITIGQIKDTEESTKLDFAKKREEREQDLTILSQKSLEREEKLHLANIDSERKRDAAEQEVKTALTQMAQYAKITLQRTETEADDEIAKIKRQRNAEDEHSKLAILEAKRDVVLKLRNALANIEKDLMETEAGAQATKLNAIQKGLIEALEGLGDKQVLTALAENMPAATGEIGYYLGLGGVKGMIEMLTGKSSLSQQLKKVMGSSDEVELQTDRALQEKTEDPDIKKE